MSKKIKMVLVLVVMLSLVSFVQADIRWFWGNGQTADWANPGGGWSGGIVPTPADNPGTSWAIIVHPCTVNVTTAGQGCGGLWLGYESGTSTLNIADGIAFQVPWQIMMGYGGACETCDGTGVLNIGVDASVDCWQLQLGVGAAPYHGIINIADGGLLTTGTLGVACQIGVAGPGEIHMTGTGSMTTQTLPVFGTYGSLDIELGSLKVAGDYRAQLQGYVDNGRITSQGGTSPRCFPVVSYHDGYTWVKTSGCTCTTYVEADVNRDCYVDFSDFALLAQGWLNCINPADANCVL